MKLSWTVGVSAVFITAGCKDPTQLLVVVDSAPQLASELRVVTAGAGATRAAAVPTDATRFLVGPGDPHRPPFSFGVAAEGLDRDAPVFIRVKATDGARQAELCIETRFEVGQTVYVPVWFDAWCGGTSCEAETCVRVEPSFCRLAGGNPLMAAEQCRLDGGVSAEDGGDAGDAPDAGVVTRDSGENFVDGGPDGGDADVPDDMGFPDSGATLLCGCSEWEWGPEVQLTNTPEPEQNPTFSPDGLHLYWSRGDGDGWKLYRATRTSTASDTFGPAQRLGVVNDCFENGGASCNNFRLSISPDGQTAYTASNRAPASSDDLFVGTFTSTAGEFTRFSRIPAPTRSPSGALDANYDFAEFDPWISTDGLRLYYLASHNPIDHPRRDFDLYYRERASPTGAFSEVEYEVLDVNVAETDQDSPSLTDDERILVYGSHEPGPPERHFIYYSTRRDRNGVFSQIRLFVDSAGAEVRTPAISRDGCELVYAKGPFESREIYKRRLFRLGGGACP